MSKSGNKIFNNFLKIISRKSVRAGFSLVEIMTVLFVISIGLMGTLALIVQNIQGQSVNKSTLIAYQLAQEGIELVRKTRDTNWAEGVSWNSGLTPGHYIMDYRNSEPRTASFSEQSNLKQDLLGFYYNADSSIDSNIDSGFTRVIDIVADPDNPSSLFIYATISWKDHNNNYSYVLEATLYDWK